MKDFISKLQQAIDEVDTLSRSLTQGKQKQQQGKTTLSQLSNKIQEGLLALPELLQNINPFQKNNRH